MATVIKTKNGKIITLYTPSEKAKKYYEQLMMGYDPVKKHLLSDSEKAYRQGYLNANRDNYKLYKYKKEKEAGRESHSKKKIYVNGVDMSDNKATAKLLKEQAERDDVSPSMKDFKLWWANRLEKNSK